MIRLLLIVLVVICGLCPATLSGSEVKPTLDGCNRLYHDSEFEAAIRCYEQLGTSAELLFNIGNSYASLDQAGYAILYYLRALCLAPGDADLLSNLSRIRTENSLFTPEHSPGDQFFSILTIYQWSYLCLAVLLFYLVYLIYLQRSKKSNSLIVSATLAAIFIFSLGCGGIWHHWHQWQRSVVIEKSRLLISPFENADSIGSIEPGRLVVAGQKYQEFVYVTDEQGRTGWLQEDHQAPIIEQGRYIQR